MGGNSSKEEGGEGGAGEASEQRGQPGEGGAAPLPRSPGKPRRSQAPQALEFEDEGGEDDGGSERKGSMWKQLSEGYGQLVDAVIRPPRSIYDVSELGPRELQWLGKRFVRHDIEVKNARGLTLQCSWWKFHADHAPQKQLPVCVHMHGNAGCRLGVAPVLEHLLSSAITVFAFDFAGSGLSEGEFVSLGHFEQEDVAAVVEYLRSTGEVSTIALWGHSMGAVTSIMFGDRDPSIAAMILDSPFCDLTQLAYELVDMSREQGFWVPGFAASMGMGSIRRAVKKRAGFDMRAVKPITKCETSFIPALFAHGEHDDFIKPHHSKKMQEVYAGDSNLILFDGDHNSERPSYFYDSVVIFLRQTLMVRDEDCLSVVDVSAGNGMHWMGGHAMDSMRATEMEMMRRAMHLSLADNGRPEAPVDLQSPIAPRANPLPLVQPQSPRDDDNLDPELLAAILASQQGGATEQQIREAVASFEAVAGVGGRTAEYYVTFALNRGLTTEDSISRFFDSGCADPPPDYVSSLFPA